MGGVYQPLPLMGFPAQTTLGFPAKLLNAAQAALDHDRVKITLILHHLLPEAHWSLREVVQLLWLPQGGLAWRV